VSVISNAWFLVIVRVVDQNVEDHAPKQLAHVTDVYVAFGHTLGGRSQLRKLRIPEPLGCGAQATPAESSALEGRDHGRRGFTATA